MAKRLTDTNKFHKRWIRGLSPDLKLLWCYLLDQCDHAGILEYDLELWNFMLGTQIEESSFFEKFGDRIQRIDGDHKIFLPGFLKFQYNVDSMGELNPKNQVHLACLKLLKKHQLLSPLAGPWQGLASPLEGSKDKDKDMVKDKDMDKEKEESKKGAIRISSINGTAWKRRQYIDIEQTEEDYLKTVLWWIESAPDSYWKELDNRHGVDSWGCAKRCYSWLEHKGKRRELIGATIINFFPTKDAKS